MSEQDTELAELVRQGQVGNPKRDPITGALTNHSELLMRTVRNFFAMEYIRTGHMKQ